MRHILPSGMAARFTFAFSLLVAVPVLLLSQAPLRTPGIFFTPTRHAIADAMLQLAGVTAGDVVYDLGSGDGRIPIIAAQKYGARARRVRASSRTSSTCRAGRPTSVGRWTRRKSSCGEFRNDDRRAYARSSRHA